MPLPRHHLVRLDLLADLTDDAGHDLCLACLRHGRRQAGTLAAPLRHSGRLTTSGAAAVELLAQELTASSRLCADTLDQREVLLHVLVATRVTAHLLPVVVRDWDGRFSLTVDDDGAVPVPADAEAVLAAYGARLQQHLDEHDSDDWVDPNVVAGDVANVHDHVVELLLWHELFGDHPVEPDHGCADADPGAGG